MLMPVFQVRFGNGLAKAQHLIGSGAAGKIYLSTVETHWTRGADYYAIPWRGRKATELGGGFLGHTIHAHDMLTTLIGPVRASVSAGGRDPRQPDRDRGLRRRGAAYGGRRRSRLAVGDAGLGRRNLAAAHLPARTSRSIERRHGISHAIASEPWTFRAQGAERRTPGSMRRRWLGRRRRGQGRRMSHSSSSTIAALESGGPLPLVTVCRRAPVDRTCDSDSPKSTASGRRSYRPIAASDPAYSKMP